MLHHLLLVLLVLPALLLWSTKCITDFINGVIIPEYSNCLGRNPRDFQHTVIHLTIWTKKTMKRQTYHTNNMHTRARID